MTDYEKFLLKELRDKERRQEMELEATRCNIREIINRHDLNKRGNA